MHACVWASKTRCQPCLNERVCHGACICWALCYMKYRYTCMHQHANLWCMHGLYLMVRSIWYLNQIFKINMIFDTFLWDQYDSLNHICKCVHTRSINMHTFDAWVYTSTSTGSMCCRTSAYIHPCKHIYTPIMHTQTGVFSCMMGAIPEKSLTHKCMQKQAYMQSKTHTCAYKYTHTCIKIRIQCIVVYTVLVRTLWAVAHTQCRHSLQPWWAAQYAYTYTCIRTALECVLYVYTHTCMSSFYAAMMSCTRTMSIQIYLHY